MDEVRGSKGEIPNQNFKTILHSDVIDWLSKYFHRELQDLDADIAALSKPPKWTTIRINTLKINKIDAIKLLQEHLSQQSDGQSFEVSTYGDVLPDCIKIPVVGPHSISDRFPEIIVDTKCGEAIMRGADIFAPGVVGAASGIRSNDRVSVMIDIDNEVHRGWTQEYHGRKLFVGNGTTTMSRTIFYVAKSGVAVKMNERVYSSPSLNGVFPDLFYLQNVPSMVVAHVLNPQPGETILDMCASPGGKTTHIAQLMQNKGVVYSFDKNENKVAVIKDLCNQLGITCVQAHKMDSTKLVLEGQQQLDNNNNEQLKGFLPETFHRVLLDPPCSGLGQRPRIKEEMALATLQSYAPYQRKLFHNAVKLLKVGGILVYSTCTLNPQENEEMVRFALDNFPLKLVSQSPFIVGSPGITWEYTAPTESEPAAVTIANQKKKKKATQNIGKGLSEDEALLVQRFRPAKDDTIGFFYSKIC